MLLTKYEKDFLVKECKMLLCLTVYRKVLFIFRIHNIKYLIFNLIIVSSLQVPEM